MGINTKGFIYGKNKDNYSTEALVQYLKEIYTNVKIHRSGMSLEWEYLRAPFTDGEDHRDLSVHYNYTSFKSEGYPDICDESIVLFDLNCWGNSIKIIEGIVAYFGGGYMVDNDCDTDDWYIVSSENSEIPEITLHNKVMVTYELSEKEATEWVQHYMWVKALKGEDVDEK